MRVRLLRSFLLSPGRMVRAGEVIELDNRTAQTGGVVVALGSQLPSHYYQVLPDEPEAAEAAPEVVSREPSSSTREVSTRNRDPQPRKRRVRKGEQ